MTCDVCQDTGNIAVPFPPPCNRGSRILTCPQCLQDEIVVMQLGLNKAFARDAEIHETIRKISMADPEEIHALLLDLLAEAWPDAQEPT